MTAETPYRIVVRRYGLLRPRNWGDDCEVEVTRMTSLWNALVEIERANRAEYLHLTTDDAIEGMQRDIDALMARRDALREERFAIRRAARKKVKTPEIDIALRGVGAQLKSLIEQSKARRRTVRDRIRPLLDALEERRREAVKAARQNSGLYWGNYNAVVASYDRARQAALKRGGTLHPRERTLRVRLTNQLQGGLSVPGLMSGMHSQVRIDPPDPRESRHPLLTATIFTGRDGAGRRMRRTVTWPIVLSRDFPPDAVIQEMIITRRELAGPWEWHAVFVCRVPADIAAPPPRLMSRAAGVELGWRKTDDGLRVAVIASGRSVEAIYLPPLMVERLLRYDDIASQRHHARQELLLRLDAVNWDRAPPDLATRARMLLAERSQTGLFDEDGKIMLANQGQPVFLATDIMLRQFVAHWRQVNFLPELRDEACDVADEDRRLWLARLSNAQTLRWRHDFYCVLATRLVAEHDVIGLRDLDWSTIARSAKDRFGPLPRRLRTIAAPGELSLCIKNAARRDGARLYRHAAPIAVTDDADVARALAAAASASAPTEEKTPAALAWQKRRSAKMLRRSRATAAVENVA